MSLPLPMVPGTPPGPNAPAGGSGPEPDRVAADEFDLGGAQPGTFSLKTLAVFVIVIAALYFGKAILVPVALAGLLSLVLSPLATRLRRRGVPRILAVMMVMGLVLAVIGGVGYVLGKQVYQLAHNLPDYKQTVLTKIRWLQTDENSGGTIKRATSVLKELGEGIESGNAASTNAPAAAGPAPAAIRLEKSPLALAREFAQWALAPIGMAGLVLVFLLFMLAESESMRDRIVRLLGDHDLNLTTEGLADAVNRVGLYLRMQLMVNTVYGLALAGGLHIIGIPNAILWGLLSGVLRFIPYLGPFIGALFPLMMAVAVDEGWSMFWWTLGLVLVVDIVCNSIIEPMVYGRSTGLSAVAIVLGAIFWTTVWGPVGLLLATPLTVCTVVAARYLPQMGFLVVLLGNAPALSVPQRFYQRMLAGDTEEGVEMSATFAELHPQGSFADEVMLPALRLADHDRVQKSLTSQRVQVVATNARAVVAEIAELAAERPAQRGTAVLCVSGRSALDGAAAELVAMGLRAQGIGARVHSDGALSDGAMEALDREGVQVVVAVFLSESALAHARGLCRRLRSHSRAKIVLGLFNGQWPATAEPSDLAAVSADFAASDTKGALEWIIGTALASPETPMVPAPIPEDEAQRLDELLSLGLLDTPSEERFDRITRELREAFDVPIALVSLVDGTRQFWKSSQGLPPELELCRFSARETSICGHVVARNEAVVVEDVLTDARFANNPFLRAHGIRFYAGVPLRGPSGLALGSLCVMDLHPRRITRAERALLRVSAEKAAAEMLGGVRGERGAPPARESIQL